MKLIMKVKLLPTTEQKVSLIKTIETFNKACNYISQIAYKEKSYGEIKLYYLCYKIVRDTFGLPAQFTVRAISKVNESYRSDRKGPHVFEKHSAIIYDQKLVSFRNLTTSYMLTVDGRINVPIVFDSYAELRQRRAVGRADLVYQDGDFFLYPVIELPITSFPPR